MIDKVDRAIVEELLKNSRTPFSSIAKKLGVAPGTVKNKFEKMQEKKIIGVCSADINLAKFGYQSKVFLIMKISRNSEKTTIIEKISQLPNMIAVAGIIGDFDLFCLAITKDIKSLNTLLKKIRGLGIEQIEIGLSVRDSIPLLPDKPEQ